MGLHYIAIDFYNAISYANLYNDNIMGKKKNN